MCLLDVSLRNFSYVGPSFPAGGASQCGSIAGLPFQGAHIRPYLTRLRRWNRPRLRKESPPALVRGGRSRSVAVMTPWPAATSSCRELSRAVLAAVPTPRTRFPFSPPCAASWAENSAGPKNVLVHVHQKDPQFPASHQTGYCPLPTPQAEECRHEAGSTSRSRARSRRRWSRRKQASIPSSKQRAPRWPVQQGRVPKGMGDADGRIYWPRGTGLHTHDPHVYGGLRLNYSAPFFFFLIRIWGKSKSQSMRAQYGCDRCRLVGSAARLSLSLLPPAVLGCRSAGGLPP